MGRLKQIVLGICCLALLSSCSAKQESPQTSEPVKQAYAKTSAIPVFVDNVPAYSDLSLLEENGTILAPIRFIAEELGAGVTWKDAQITIKNRDLDLVLYEGKNEALLNGDTQSLPAIPRVINGHAYLPLRFISEALQARVIYRNQKVFIYTSLYNDDYLQNQYSFLVQQGEWIYAILDYQGQTGIYRFDSSFSNPKLIKSIDRQEFDTNYEMMVISGDYLYYHDKELNLSNLEERKIESFLKLPYSPVIIRGNEIYFIHSQNKGIAKQTRGSGKEEIFTLDYAVRSIFAISNTGVVYFSDLGIMHYSFSTKQSTELFDGAVLVIGGYHSDSPEFTANGDMYYDAASETYNHYTIFQMDIDGTNSKEIFTEEKYHLIQGIKVYDGWVYYVTIIPVIVDHGTGGGSHIDYYTGSLNRVKIDGSSKQTLTEEHIANYGFFEKGIYYKHYQYGDTPNEGIILFSDLEQ